MRCKESLLFVCKFLSKQRAWEVLVDVQTFMSDFSRAGLTSLHLFMETDPLDFTRRQMLLANAKKHFEDAMIASTLDSVLTSNEISVKLGATNLQISLLDFIQKNIRNVQPELLRATLFGTTKEKSSITEQVLAMGNFDLAFQFVQQFQLPAVKLYGNVVKSFISAKQNSKAIDILRALKVFYANSLLHKTTFLTQSTLKSH